MTKREEEKPAPCPKCGEHCYARWMNKGGAPVWSEDKFCPRCGAHLSASEICLNGCHLSASSRAAFAALVERPNDPQA